jgi:hypothetical protein
MYKILPSIFKIFIKFYNFSLFKEYLTVLDDIYCNLQEKDMSKHYVSSVIQTEITNVFKCLF